MSKHGCYNKPRHDAQQEYTVQDGWTPTVKVTVGNEVEVHRAPLYANVKTVFMRGCKYDQKQTDKNCAGCTRKDIE